jgi:hypothetical protein
MMNITSECSVVAEVLIEGAPAAVCTVAIPVGIYMFNPAITATSCAPWIWLNTNPAFKEMIKLATELGCVIVMEVSSKDHKVSIIDFKNGANQIKQTYKALNTPSGMMWLVRYLSAR